jgi:hypothetical protein
MTLSNISVETLDFARLSNPVLSMLMSMDNVELQRVQPGYFVGPLNSDQLVKFIEVGEPWRLEVEGIGTYPTSFYVCDSPEQFIERYGKVLEKDERIFAVFFTPMLKSEQSPEGGWRWHKWGEYVGDGEPTTEYLYDEPEFERVYTVNITSVAY